MTSQGGVEGQNIFSHLGTYVLFMEQPVVCLSLYNRANHWFLEPGWGGQQHLTAPI